MEIKYILSQISSRGHFIFYSLLIIYYKVLLYFYEVMCKINRLQFTYQGDVSPISQKPETLNNIKAKEIEIQ